MKRVNIVEFFLVVSFVFIVELVELAVTFFVGPGELVKWIINIIFWFPVRFWLKIKGVAGKYYDTAFFVEFIPFINALPIKSVVLIIAIYRHNKQVNNNE